MVTKIWWNRALMSSALLLASLMSTVGTAEAATQCFSQSYSDGAKIVPGTGGGNVTRSIARQKAASDWYDVVWRGDLFLCPGGTTCSYAWQKSKTSTASWNLGGSTDAGNASSPNKKWYNIVLTLVGGYNSTTEVNTTFTFTVNMKGGEKAAPVNVAVRRWTEGDFVGGWVRSNRGCKGGTSYDWDGNVRFGKWNRNVFQRWMATYEINGQVRPR